MTDYKRLGETYEGCKPLIDYARTVATLFALAGLAAVAVRGAITQPPEHPVLYHTMWFALTMFGMLVAAVFLVCIRLTSQLLLDMLYPELVGQPWRGLIYVVATLFAYAINLGSGSIFVYSITSIIT